MIEKYAVTAENFESKDSEMEKIAEETAVDKKFLKKNEKIQKNFLIQEEKNEK